MKKRKLGSRNPKYAKKTDDNLPVIDKKVHVCDAPTRDSNGRITDRSTTVPVYAVFYKNDPVEVKVKEKKWWKNN